MGWAEAEQRQTRRSPELRETAAKMKVGVPIRGSEEGENMADLETLKKKYQAVIDLAKVRGVVLKNVHIEGDKLLIRGDAPNQAVKNEVWDKVKAVDAAYADLTVDISIDSSLPVPAKVYVVQAGDTLSKIAKHFYGDATKYMKIFEANKDHLKNPDTIKVGQELKIPE